MTAQISDTFEYESREYDVIAMSEPIRFDPTDYGLEPHMSSTACYRGYWCKYAIDDEGLILDRLYLFNADNKYPPLNGVNVSLLPEQMGHRVYEPKMRIDYTGKVVLGDDFLDEYYVHMGFQSAWAYEMVKEFSFKDGRLVDIIDYSELMAKYRDLINEDPEGFYKGMHKNISKFVEDSFSLDFETKAWWLE